MLHCSALARQRLLNIVLELRFARTRATPVVHRERGPYVDAIGVAYDV
jgi:hypothetical protein